jgi:OOP family OmpA-OmpF porin
MTPKNQLSAISLCGLSLMASNCFAQEQPYYYGGVSVGQSETNLEADHITQTQIGNGFTIDSIKRDEKDTAYKLFGGYQFNRFYALEGGFFYLGKPHFTANTTPAGTLNGQTKMQGWNLDVVGTLAMTDRLSALARVGLIYTTTTATFTGTGAVVPGEANPRRTQTSYKGGLGLQYEVSPSFLVRAEFERYRVSDAMDNHNGVNVASVSMIFPFGRSPAPAQHALAEPAPYVAQAPALQEMPPPAAGIPEPVPPPSRKRVTFSAESLFTFDKSAVQPDGQAALDTFAKELNGTQFDVINVEGHTDKIGSQEYNQRLSEERAEAVKVYLIESGKVDPSKISASGKSESMPVTKPGECKGNKHTKKLIECLQPDRRVEIEVVGTR